MLSGTTLGFVCVFAILMASIFAALLDRKERSKGNKDKAQFLSRTALILFIAAFVGGVAMTLVGGTKPRSGGQGMTGRTMGGGEAMPEEGSDADEGQPPMARGPMGSIGKVDEKEVEALKQRLEKNPKDVAAMERLGHLSLQMQDFQSVFKYAHEALLVDPKSAESLAHMGMVYSAMQQKDKAMEQFNAAVKANPKLTEALLFKGILEFQNDDWKNAKATWDQFMKISKPNDPGRTRVEMFLKTVNEQLSISEKK